MRSFELLGTALVLFILPVVALAATPTSFAGFVDLIIGILNQIVGLVFVLVFVFMLWKLVDVWIINVDDEKKRTGGKSIALTAVLVFVLMLLTWGIVAMIRSSVFG